MLAETRTTVRNAGWLVVEQGAQVASGVLFALLIPRAMGSVGYGQYALIASLSMWFLAGSRLGMTQVLGRHVPEVGRGAPLQELMGRLLTVQLGVSALTAVGFYVATRLWLADVDAWALALFGITLFVRGLSSLLASLQHGLNRGARWGLSQVLRGWLALVALAVGYRLAALRGASAGLLVSELLVLAANLRWAWPHVGWLRPRLDLGYLRPYASLALLFSAAELVATSARRSGETILRLLALPYATIGHYGLAYDIAAMGTLALSQIVSSFLPLCVRFTQAGESERLLAVLHALLRTLAALAMVVVYATLLLGPALIPAVLGAEFGPVAANLVPLALLLVITPWGSSGRVLCIVTDRPRIALIADVVQLACFWAVGVPLARWRGGLGLSLAVLASALAAAGYIQLAVGARARDLTRAWARVVLLGSCGVPFCLLPVEGLWRWGLWLAVTVAYAVALLACRLITTAQVRSVLGMLRPRRDGA